MEPTLGAAQCNLFFVFLLSRPEITDFEGLAAPGGPGNPSNRWGGGGNPLWGGGPSETSKTQKIGSHAAAVAFGLRP